MALPLKGLQMRKGLPKKKKSLTVTVLWLTHHFRNTVDAVDMKDNFDPPYYLIAMSLGIL